MPTDKLTPKQAAFVEFYLVSWNAADAARQAGYSTVGAYVQGSRMLTKANIKAAIQRRLAGLTMAADEWFARVTDQARSDLGELLDDQGDIDWVEAKKKNKTRLISEYQVEQSFRPDNNGDYHPVTKTRFKLYSAQHALEMLALRLFTPKLQVEHIDTENPYAHLTQEEIEVALKAIDKLTTRRQKEITAPQEPKRKRPSRG